MASTQRGSALLISVFLLAIITMLGVGIVAQSTNDLKVSHNYQKTTETLYASEAGAQYVVALLNGDPSIGDVAPDPTGTPMYTGKVGDYSWKLWVWNERYYDSMDVTVPFEVSGTRQVVVEASDGRRTKRRLSAIVEPNYPEALKRAIVSCGTVSLNNNGNDDVSGNIYAAGAVTYSSQITGSIWADGNVALPDGDVAGNVYASGSITNSNASNVLGTCKATGSINRTQDCGSAVEYAGTDPVPTYCDPTLASWNEDLLSLSSDEIQDLKDSTPLSNTHTGGWIVSSDTTIAGQHLVESGNLYATAATITYGADTLILVENGGVYCTNCRFVPEDSAARLSIITAGSYPGSILFSATTTKSSEINGVLWTGIVTGTTLPTGGGVIVSGSAQVTVNGSIIVATSTGQVSGPSNNGWLRVERTGEIPAALFGADDGFQITEWREVRK